MSPALVDDGSCTAPVQSVVMAMPRAVRLTGTQAMEPTRSTDGEDAPSPSWATTESKVMRNTVRRPPVTTALSWRCSPPHDYRSWATAIAFVQGADRPTQPSSAPRSVSPPIPLASQRSQRQQGDPAMTWSRVLADGGAAGPRSVAGRIACIAASSCEAFACPWPPSSPGCTLRDHERTRIDAL
jgi:hypothetical protein